MSKQTKTTQFLAHTRLCRGRGLWNITLFYAVISSDQTKTYHSSSTTRWLLIRFAFNTLIMLFTPQSCDPFFHVGSTFLWHCCYFKNILLKRTFRVWKCAHCFQVNEFKMVIVWVGQEWLPNYNKVFKCWMCFNVRFKKLMRRHRHDLTLVLQSIRNRLPGCVSQYVCVCLWMLKKIQPKGEHWESAENKPKTPRLMAVCSCTLCLCMGVVLNTVYGDPCVMFGEYVVDSVAQSLFKILNCTVHVLFL